MWRARSCGVRGLVACAVLWRAIRRRGGVGRSRWRPSATTAFHWQRLKGQMRASGPGVLASHHREDLLRLNGCEVLGQCAMLGITVRGAFAYGTLRFGYLARRAIGFAVLPIAHPKKKTPLLGNKGVCARGGGRTLTGVIPLAPETSASAIPPLSRWLVVAIKPRALQDT